MTQVFNWIITLSGIIFENNLAIVSSSLSLLKAGLSQFRLGKYPGK